MDLFTRSFPDEQIDILRQNSGVAALFDRWVLPGEPADIHGLRLAVRNGYLSFYAKGQSVGELRASAGKPRLRIHRKYREGAVKGSEAAAILGQKYDTLRADALAETDGEIIDRWIETAQTYAGDEKRFVDGLVAVTPGVLDLEMALPADDGSTGEDRVAPRMDLVVAQSDAIAFWEAKCATNSELRALRPYEEKDEGGYIRGPHVVWQLRRYQRWMQRPGRLDQVRSAYVETARLLLKFAEACGKTGPAIDAWQHLADATEPSVIVPPGIVVAGYTPTPATGGPKQADANAARLGTFEDYKKILKSHGATVAVVDAPSKARLPDLSDGCIHREPRA